jgi:hypothetical protein
VKQVLVVGEDALCCTLGERLALTLLPNWTLARESINTRGITKLVPSLSRYLEQAQHIQPIICIADTDGRCPVDLLKAWLRGRDDIRFVFRLAVAEAESWLLADRESLANFFGVSVAMIPSRPDEVANPKREVLSLAQRSRRRPIRSEVVSSLDPSKPGTGYNLHLCEYVRTHWRALLAAAQSPSLAKAIQGIRTLENIA